MRWQATALQKQNVALLYKRQQHTDTHTCARAHTYTHTNSFTFCHSGEDENADFVNRYPCSPSPQSPLADVISYILSFTTDSKFDHTLICFLNHRDSSTINWNTINLAMPFR